MTLPACASLHPDSSVYFINLNASHAHYSCRGGYRYLAGDHHRSCDSNGTWTGHALQCTVDSVMPKTYLVILIVGATIAIFVACIPYDFYRFRKRKKKVRDHQERLSLVTRIAPTHAAVILDTDTAASKTAPEPPRKFGFKSLFSVFRFVGAKMKTAGEEEPKSNLKSENGKGKSIGEEGSSGSDGACGSGSGSGGNVGCSSGASRSGSGKGSSCGGCGSGGVGVVEKSYTSGEGYDIDDDNDDDDDDDNDDDNNDDGAIGMPTTSSSFVLNPLHSSGCPRSRDDVIELCGPGGNSFGCRGNNLVNKSSPASSPGESSTDNFDDRQQHAFQNNKGDNSRSPSQNSAYSYPSNNNSNNDAGSSSRSSCSSEHRSVTPPKKFPSSPPTPTTSIIDSAAFRNAIKKSNSTSLASSRKSKPKRSANKIMPKSVSDTKINPANSSSNRTVSRSSVAEAKKSNSNPATVEVTPISSATTSPTMGSSRVNVAEVDFPVYIAPPPPPSSSSSSSAIMTGSSSISSSSSPNLCNDRQRGEERSRTFFHSQTGSSVDGGGGDAFHSMPTIGGAP